MAGLKRMNRMSKQISLIVLLLSIFITISRGQNNNAYRYVRIDTTKIISQSDLVKIADRFVKRYYAAIYDLNEKGFVDARFKMLDTAKESKLKMATSLSSAATLIAGVGESQHAPIVFSAKAVILFPRDTLIVNNFGAMLRLLDSTELSLKVLLYAKSVCPDAPVILTNLGNTLFELYDDRSAEYFFKKALRVNPDFSPARQSLVTVYLKRKDLKSAMTELFKSVKSAYCESMGKVHEDVKYSHAYSPPGEAPGDKPGNENGGQGQDGPNPNVPIDKLSLPGFPNWSDAKALIHDQSIEKVSKQLSEITKQAGAKEMDAATSLTKMSPEQQVAWWENEKKPGRILYKKNSFGMELLGEYFEDQLDKADDKFSRADSINIVKFGKAVEEAYAGDEERAKSMTTPEWKEFFIQKCKKLKVIKANYFLQWRTLTATRHQEYTDQLMTYWIYCEQYLNRTYDLNEFEKLNNDRKSFVSMHMSMLYTAYSIGQIGFTFQNIASLATAEGECPQEEPTIETLPGNPDDKVEIPDGKEPPCPFKNSAGKIGVKICSVVFDCESIKLECTAGWAGSVKWNGKKKEMTVFGGAGVKVEGSLGYKKLGAAHAEFEAKTGFEVSFSTKGQITDVAYVSEVSGGLGAGDYQAGQKMEMRISAMTGIDVERTNELTYTVFE